MVADNHVKRAIRKLQATPILNHKMCWGAIMSILGTSYGKFIDIHPNNALEVPRQQCRYQPGGTADIQHAQLVEVLLSGVAQHSKDSLGFLFSFFPVKNNLRPHFGIFPVPDVVHRWAHPQSTSDTRVTRG